MQQNLEWNLNYYISKQFGIWNLWNSSANSMSSIDLDADYISKQKCTVKSVQTFQLGIRKITSTNYPWLIFQATDYVSNENLEFYEDKKDKEYLPYQSFHLPTLFNFVNKKIYQKPLREVVTKIDFDKFILDSLEKGVIKTTKYQDQYIYLPKVIDYYQSVIDLGKLC